LLYLYSVSPEDRGEADVRVPSRDLFWLRSSRCADRACAEVAADGDVVYVRDSKAPEGAVLGLTRTEWEAFRDGVKRGDFDDI